MTRFRSAAMIAVVMAASAGQAHADDRTDAAALVRHYYHAIDAHHYRTAFNDWDNAASGVLPTGQSYSAFKKGFRHTAHVSVKVGPVGDPEGAAGSSFIEVPVTVHAMTTGGAQQTFKGTYTLRKSNLAIADGVTPEQQRWHLYAAHLRAGG